MLHNYLYVEFTSYYKYGNLIISADVIYWIISNKDSMSENTIFVVLENLFISIKSILDIHGSLTTHNCTIQTDLLVFNLKGGIYLSSADQGKGTHFQSYFDRHSIKITQTYILGNNYSTPTVHGKNIF